MSGGSLSGGRYVCSSPIPEKRKLTRAGIVMRPAADICETVLSGTNSIMSIPSSLVSSTESKKCRDQLGEPGIASGSSDGNPDRIKSKREDPKIDRNPGWPKHLKVTQTGSLDITPGSRYQLQVPLAKNNSMNSEQLDEGYFSMHPIIRRVSTVPTETKTIISSPSNDPFPNKSAECCTGRMVSS